MKRASHWSSWTKRLRDQKADVEVSRNFQEGEAEQKEGSSSNSAAATVVQQQQQQW
jgi:hypothetical protein